MLLGSILSFPLLDLAHRILSGRKRCDAIVAIQADCLLIEALLFVDFALEQPNFQVACSLE